MQQRAEDVGLCNMQLYPKKTTTMRWEEDDDDEHEGKTRIRNVIVVTFLWFYPFIPSLMYKIYIIRGIE